MEEQPEQGLQGMKFMKRAREKKLLQSLDLIDQIERDVRGEQEEEQEITGRMSFAGKKTSGPSTNKKIDGSIVINKQVCQFQR
jgi:hypothetical protein